MNHIRIIAPPFSEVFFNPSPLLCHPITRKLSTHANCFQDMPVGLES